MKKFRDDISNTEIQHVEEEDHANTQGDGVNNVNENVGVIMHQCLDPVVQTVISKEQQNRMDENRRKAEEKRRSRLVLENISQPSTNACKNNNCEIGEEFSCDNNLTMPTIDVEMLDVDEFLENLPEKV